MTSSTKNVKLGVCRLYYGGTDLGLTMGGVDVTVTTDTHNVTVDQFGKTIINDLIMGRNCKVKAPLAETTVRNLAAVMPGSSLISDGVQASNSLTFAANPTGASTFTIGGQLFTFSVTKPTTQYGVLLGTTLAASLANAADVINRAMLQTSIGGIQATVDAVNAPGVLSLVVGDPGVLGNAVTLAASIGATVASATFAGGVVETRARIEVSVGMGLNLLSTSKVLRLHPIAKADGDFSDDFVIYQAGTSGALTYAYKFDAERTYAIEFNGYPDANGRLFSVGDLLA